MDNGNKIIELKEAIKKLAVEHQQTGDDLEDYKDSDLIELQAKQILIDYCVNCGYMINGFPHKMMEMDEDDLEEDYFSSERYSLYLDSLTLIKEDVGELHWYLTKSFWSENFNSKSEYLTELKDLLESGVLYDDIIL